MNQRHDVLFELNYEWNIAFTRAGKSGIHRVKAPDLAIALRRFESQHRKGASIQGVRQVGKSDVATEQSTESQIEQELSRVSEVVPFVKETA